MDAEQHISKAKLKFIRSLAQKKVREEESLFIAEGWRAVEDACGAGITARTFLHTPEAADNTHFRAVFERAVAASRETFELSAREFEAVTETVTPQGVAMVLPTFSHDLHRMLSGMHDDVPHVIVALDTVSEPGNAGTIIRTSDWFGAGMVLLSERSVELYNPKVVRSTMGSLFHLPIVECGRGKEGRERPQSFIEALDACRQAGFMLYGADVNASTDIRAVRWPKKCVIVIGNEAHGLTPDVSAMLDGRVAIPKFGRAESLNAGIAAAVLLGSLRLR